MNTQQTAQNGRTVAEEERGGMNTLPEHESATTGKIEPLVAIRPKNGKIQVRAVTWKTRKCGECGYFCNRSYGSVCRKTVFSKTLGQVDRDDPACPDWKQNW